MLSYTPMKVLESVAKTCPYQIDQIYVFFCGRKKNQNAPRTFCLNSRSLCIDILEMCIYLKLYFEYSNIVEILHTV